MRPGVAQTLAALVMGAVTMMCIVITASGHQRPVGQLVVLAVVIFVAGTLVGSHLLVGLASAPMLGSALIESAASDDPTLVRSLVIGSLWYLTVEMAWEAIDRRDGSLHSRAANVRRVQEAVTVVGLALVIGCAAIVASGVAPVRTLLVQAVVIVGFLVAFIVAVRRFDNLAEDDAIVARDSQQRFKDLGDAELGI